MQNETIVELIETIVELNEITKHFGSVRALDGISLQIGPGVTGLLGPNGAGKSTLIKVLLGLVRPSSGTGRVLDCRLDKQVRKIRAQVGYMPEDDCFWYGLTGVESVQLAAQLSRAGRRSHVVLVPGARCGVGSFSTQGSRQ